MKHGRLIFPLFLVACLFASGTLSAQAFHKGSLLVSLTEGTTYAHVVATDNSTATKMVTDKQVDGDRDPLIVEYGLSNKWGIGINMGGDILHVDPNTFYNVHTTATQAITGEFSLEANYHYFVTKKWDLVAAASAGFASVHFEGSEGQGDGSSARDYNAGGGIIRLSAKARYYFFRRLGVEAILSTYTSSCTPDPDKDNSILKKTTTNVSGHAFELGICYRFLR